MIWFSLAVKSLVRNKKFSLTYIAVLFIGLVSCISVANIKLAALSYLKQDLKKVLTADLTAHSREDFSKEQVRNLEVMLGDFEKKTKKIDFFSMVQGKNIARIVRVQAIEKNFPLYGSFEIAGDPVTNQKIQQELLKENKLWTSKQTRETLGLKEGDKVKIGNQEFTLGKDITKSPLEVFGGVAIAPSVYISLQKLADTKLLQTGSRINYRLYYKFLENEKDIELLSEEIEKRIQQEWGDENSIHIHSYLEASDNITEVLHYTTGFLGLISIATLFVASIGISYIFQNYFKSCLKDIGIFISFGTKLKKIYLLYIIQLFLLGLVATLLAIFFANLMTTSFLSFLKNYLPNDFSFSLANSSIIIALLLGIFSSFIFAIPSLLSLHSTSPLILFGQGKISRFLIAKNFSAYGSYFFILIFFWGLSIWQAGFISGSIFLLSFLTILGLLALFCFGILFLLEKISSKTNFFFSAILRNLYRKKFISFLFFLAISSNIFIANLILQVQNNIRQEFQKPKGVIIPDFFLFDIQTQQLKNLKNFLQKEGFQLENISPLIRARLKTINNQPLEIESEEERQGMSQRRGFNISYRKNLSSSEVIVAGKKFTHPEINTENAKVEISVEQDFAKRQNLKIGDEMLFEIAGINIIGKIINLRKVKWNSFQPNFFVLFQTGALEYAPKTYLASIASIPQEYKSNLQVNLTRKFPNISLIDISKLVALLLEIATKATWVILSLTTLFAFAFVLLLIFIIKNESKKKSWETSLLQHFGYTKQKLILSSVSEFFLWGFLASSLGLFLSYFCHFFVSKFLFDFPQEFSFSITSNILIIFVIALLTINAIVIYNITQQKIIYLLRET